MIAKSIEPSESLDQAQDRFLDDLGRWIDGCIDTYADAAPSNGHDQLTFVTYWETYLRARPNDRAVAFLRDWRDRVRDHFVAEGRWRHGYWTMQEAHHGTEHFELFLAALHRIDPHDSDTRAQLLDAAEHIGNWSSDVPPWFDESTGVFRSFYFGADGVEMRPGTELNAPDHLRLVTLCLLAHEMSADARYLDFAVAYARRWAEAIADSDALPVGLLPKGGVYQMSSESDGTYRSFAGMVGQLDDQVERAENILASGGVNALVALWEQSGEDAFQRAAERMVDVLVTQLGDADAGVAADAIRVYRRATGDTRYDAAVAEAASALDPHGFAVIGMEPSKRKGAKPWGIGKRTDMPEWFEDGEPRRHSPVLLAVAAEIDEDEALATRAIDIARAYFALACDAMPDGHKHGCAANTVSAIARGHGRENHVGVVTGVLQPLMERFAAR